MKDMLQQQNGALATAAEIPDCYVLPPHLQPGLSAKAHVNFPLIDMAGVCNNPEQRKQALASIREACNEWGFFQVIGHGPPADLRKRMLGVGHEFFDLPLSEKVKYQNSWTASSDRPILGQSRLTASGHHSWRDSFRHKAAPVSDAEVEEWWPAKPESYRETVMEYSQATKKVATTILELIAEGLNLSIQHFYDALGGADELEYTLMLGYYPRCPQPDKALGLVGHTDPNLITLLIQDEPGLEVVKNGLWIPVVPAPNGIVVNVGDALQIMINDKYLSNEHRVVASKKRDRMSAMIFVNPKVNSYIRVVRSLVPSNTTPVYDDIPWGEYMKYARSGLDKKLTNLARK